MEKLQTVTYSYTYAARHSISLYMQNPSLFH